MPSRKTSKSEVAPNEVPKAVLKALEHAGETTMKRRLASIIRGCILVEETSKKLGLEVEIIDTGDSDPLSTMIQIGDQYFTIRVTEHR